MNCPKCGAPIEDGAKFCMACGCNLESGAESINHQAALVTPEQPNLPVPHKQSNGVISRLVKKAITLLVGTAIILLGAWRLSSAGTTISSMAFGADFFTYSYQGIVAISEILAEVEKSIGFLIIAVGAAIDVSALRD